MRIYLAGKMRGVPLFNRPAFIRAAARLRAEGHEVYSPAEYSDKLFGPAVRNNAYGDEGQMGGDEETISRTVFSMDMIHITLYAECVALIPGWETSAGATAEKAVATALRIKVWELDRSYIE